MPSPYNQNFDDPFRLPASAANVIPAELGQNFLATLDKDLQLQEKKRTEDLFALMEQRGILPSGITQKNLVEQILGPGLQRRQQALLPLALAGAETGQKQRFETETGQREFEHKRQLNQDEFNFRLQYLREQSQMNEELLRLKRQLESPDDFLRQIGSGFASGFGETAGSGAAKGIFTLL